MARLFGPFFVFAGIMHFLKTRSYERIMPPYIPRHRELVYISGVAELAGGAGVLIPATRRAAAWWLILTLIAIFPANLNMAVNADRFAFVAEPLLWARLPVQGALIAWVWRAALR